MHCLAKICLCRFSFIFLFLASREAATRIQECLEPLALSPLMRFIPDKRPKGVRQRKEICRTRSQLLDRQEEPVGNGLRTQARRVLLCQMAQVYQQASGSQKQHILEECVTATEYSHTYAQWLLNHAEEVLSTPVVLRRRYGLGYEPSDCVRHHSCWSVPVKLQRAGVRIYFPLPVR